MKNSSLKEKAVASPLLTTAQAAKYLGLSISTFTKKVPVKRIRLGRACIRYLQEDLDAYINTCAENPLEAVDGKSE